MAQLPFVVAPLALGTVATGNELSYKPASHLGEFKDIGMTWKSSGASNLWVRGDFGSAKAVDFVALLSANAVSATTIRIRLGDSQANVDGAASYDSGAQTFISPSITREDGLYHSHWQLPSLQTRRWWRIDIGSHTGDFEASILVLGKRITPARYYSAGFETGVQDQGTLEFGRWGVVNEETGLILRTLRFELGWVTEAEEYGSFAPLAEKLGKRGFALWCFDPTSSVYRQQKTYFGPVTEHLYAAGGKFAPGVYAREFSVLSII